MNDLKKAKTPEILARILFIKEELDARKALYEEFDLLVVELARRDFTQALVGEMTVMLKDNFAEDKNTGWTSAAVKRFDIETLTPDQVARREKKRAKAAGES